MPLFNLGQSRKTWGTHSSLDGSLQLPGFSAWPLHTWIPTSLTVHRQANNGVPGQVVVRSCPTHALWDARGMLEEGSWQAELPRCGPQL